MDFTAFILNSRSMFQALSVLIVLCIYQQCYANITPDAQIHKLDQKFISLSSTFYAQQVKTTSKKPTTYTALEPLLADVEQYISNQQNVKAILLIIQNKKLIESNLDHPATLSFLSVLLNHNELTTANKLHAQIQNNAYRGTISSASYLFARYFYTRKEYNKTLSYLTGIAEDLPGEESNHAVLLSGICLQKLKKHRQSIKVYLNVEKTSNHYPAAMLNMAIANIRQGWWTDGHIMLQNILNDPKYKNSETILNRLHLVLGYSLLYKEFYRNARDSFRNVSLNSKHTNRALMGIALTATNQEDYVGALNALTILNSKKTVDMTVDESYLLLPYIYEKLGQGLTASSSYTDAMEHYTTRINSLKSGKAIMNSKNFKINKLFNDDSIHVGTIKLVYTQEFPKYLVENFNQLYKFNKTLASRKNSKLTRKLDKLYAAYSSQLKALTLKIIDTRISYLNSYMNQSRYGLARLYDSSAENQ
jgi:hypothetical protein